MQYHHFLAADCCSGLNQLQSLYHRFLTLQLDLVPMGWLVVFSNANPYTSNDGRSPAFTCERIRCALHIWFQYICRWKQYRSAIAGRLPASGQFALNSSGNSGISVILLNSISNWAFSPGLTKQKKVMPTCHIPTFSKSCFAFLKGYFPGNYSGAI